MGKRIQTPEPPETVTLPKTSIDLIFQTLEEMKNEIIELRGKIEKEQFGSGILTTKEAAEFCGVSRWTIDNYYKRKIIDKVISGCKVGYSVEDLKKIRKVKKGAR